MGRVSQGEESAQEKAGGESCEWLRASGGREGTELATENLMGQMEESLKRPET